MTIPAMNSNLSIPLMVAEKIGTHLRAPPHHKHSNILENVGMNSIEKIRLPAVVYWFYMMGYGYGGYGMMDGGVGIFGTLFMAVVLIDLILLGFFLWQKIKKQ